MATGLNIPILLASTSPRRIYLMSQVHLAIEVQIPQADETPLRGEKPNALVRRLARQKADSVRHHAIQRYPRSLIIAADTIVVAPDGRTILGKPRDKDDARKMLKCLAGNSHSVVTGYCISLAARRGTEKTTLRTVKSRVKMRPLTNSMIQRYIASGEPMDKAGSYGAQGLGMALIERIDGSYTNVVGLPMAQLIMDLEKVFGIQLYSWTL